MKIPSEVYVCVQMQPVGKGQKVREMRAIDNKISVRNNDRSMGEIWTDRAKWSRREYGDLSAVDLIKKWLRGPVTWH